MGSRDAEEKEYFDDPDTGEVFITVRGALILTGYAQGRSVLAKITPVPALGKQQRAPRGGRPVQQLLRLKDVEDLRRERAQANDGTDVRDRGGVGPVEKPETATRVTPLQDARFRQQIEALTTENAQLRQRLEAIEPLLVQQMETTQRLLHAEDGSGSAS